METLRYIFSTQGSSRPYCRDEHVHEANCDNTCAVLYDSHVIYASESERFTKVKHDYYPPFANLEAFKHNFIKNNKKPLENYNLKRLPKDHHLNHIYEAFYQSGFKESAILVNDGFGQRIDTDGTHKDCITLAYMKEGSEPQILKKFAYGNNNSPTSFYGNIADLVFGEKHAEGKLMGLAGYGKDNNHRYIKWDPSKQEIFIDEKLFIKDLNKCKKTRLWNKNGVIGAKDIAYTFQKQYEDVFVEITKLFACLLEENNINTENLCLSGGGVLNCPTNSKIIDLNLFKHYYASPQPGDGCANSIGYCLRQMHQEGEKLTSEKLKDAYLGVPYSVTEYPTRIEKIKDPIRTCCNYLKSGGVIAWFQGRAEFGPRALGHRSFLADPTNKQMLDSLNKIKNRETWRPLAPIVPEVLFKRIFEVENTDMCEFMLRTLRIKDRWIPKMQAVCHVDGTTRPQLLKEEVNPQLYAIIMEYFNITGVPCLVNTSLNINGFPIVETPIDFSFLAEEVDLMEDIPPVEYILCENESLYRVLPEFMPEKSRKPVQDYLFL